MGCRYALSLSLPGSSLLFGGPSLDFGETVAGAGIEIEGVELLQVTNASERFWLERSLAVEGVQNDAFEQVTQGHVVILGESLKNFEEPFFHADAGLDALDEKLWFGSHGTNVPWYINNNNEMLWTVVETGQAPSLQRKYGLPREKMSQTAGDRAGRSHRMCRNIKILFNFDPPVTDEEVRAASLQFVRKITGFNKPSKANEDIFLSAVDEVAAISTRLLRSLETNAPPKNREEEAARAKARAAERFGA